MRCYILSILTFLLATSINHSQELDETKKNIISSIENHQSEIIKISDQIWELAELAFNEYESSKILSDYAEKNGFIVEKGVAGMPTAFVASYGSGKPVISVLGEFDALPGLSQDTTPNKNPLIEGGSGHGCGHNMFGAASLASAIAIKEQIESGDLKGTIKFFGTPSEETNGCSANAMYIKSTPLPFLKPESIRHLNPLLKKSTESDSEELALLLFGCK